MRRIFEKLNWGKGVTYVIGHTAPDTDTVCSAITYANLMRELGYNCKAAVAGKPNKETQYILERFKVEAPQTLEDATGCRVILMDHSEYAQAVHGAPQARILQVIDHHGIGNITESHSVIYRSLPIGATCTIVYQCYKEFGVGISKESASLLIAGILSDTNCFTKASTTFIDLDAVSELSEIAGLEDLHELYKEMERATTDYSGMSDGEIFLNNMKNYSIGEIRIAIGSIDVPEMNDAEPGLDEKEMEFIDRMHAVMPQIMKELNLDFIFAKIDNHRENATYILHYGKESDEIVKRAFIASAGEDGVSAAEIPVEEAIDKAHEGEVHLERKICGEYIKFTPTVNRKFFVLPRITEAIKQKMANFA